MRQPIENDPLLQNLLHEQEIAFRDLRRALVSLRRLYSLTSEPDVYKAAHAQQVAHDASHRLDEATHALSVFCWELVPFSKDPDHLERIDQLRKAGAKRVLDASTPVTPKNAGPVMIITTINGVKKRFIE
jgi:hypothetical protein